MVELTKQTWRDENVGDAGPACRVSGRAERLAEGDVELPVGRPRGAGAHRVRGSPSREAGRRAGMQARLGGPRGEAPGSASRKQQETLAPSENEPRPPGAAGWGRPRAVCVQTGEGVHPLQCPRTWTRSPGPCPEPISEGSVCCAGPRCGGQLCRGLAGLEAGVQHRDAGRPARAPCSRPRQLLSSLPWDVLVLRSEPYGVSTDRRPHFSPFLPFLQEPAPRRRSCPWLPSAARPPPCPCTLRLPPPSSAPRVPLRLQAELCVPACAGAPPPRQAPAMGTLPPATFLPVPRFLHKTRHRHSTVSTLRADVWQGDRPQSRSPRSRRGDWACCRG